MASTREVWLDVLKAFLILLVVAGHAVQTADTAFAQNPIFKWIYSFHMPLFFFVSGFVTYKPQFDGSDLSRKLRRLMIPFVIWATVSFLLQLRVHALSWKFVTEYYQTIVIRPDVGLWFLWVLATCLCFLYACRVCSRGMLQEAGLQLVGLLLVNVCIAITAYNKYAVHLTAYYLPFFLSGYWVRRFRLNEKDWILPLSVLALFVFIILGLSWTWKGDIVLAGSVHLPRMVSQWYRMVVAWMAIIGIFGLTSRWKEKLSNAFPLIAWIGRSTLGIYAVHYYLIGLVRYFGSYGMLGLVMGTVTVFMPTCCIVWVFGRLQYLRKLV